MWLPVGGGDVAVGGDGDDVGQAQGAAAWSGDDHGGGFAAQAGDDELPDGGGCRFIRITNEDQIWNRNGG